jgi:hypothetical protein
MNATRSIRVDDGRARRALARRLRQTWRLVAANALCLPLVAACHSAAPKAIAPPPRPAADFARYLPLVNDTVFAYDTSSDDNAERGVLMLRVRRTREDYAELGAGSRIQRLDLGTDGIRHATGGYLLKAPLEPGKHWKGQFGDVSVVSVDRIVNVPAGKFASCIETLERATAPVQKTVRTTFCRDVGIVLLEAEGLVNGNYTHERAALRSFGPAIDLNVNPPNPDEP